MQFILLMTLAGVVGTAGMIAFLWLVNRSGLAHADMVRALGSALRGSLESSTVIGAIVQFAGGIPIAVLYLFALSILRTSGFWQLTGAGALIGFVHGFLFSFLVLVLARHHPVERFREASFEVVAAYITSHIVYGTLVGAVVGASGMTLPL